MTDEKMTKETVCAAVKELAELSVRSLHLSSTVAAVGRRDASIIVSMGLVVKDDGGRERVHHVGEDVVCGLPSHTEVVGTVSFGEEVESSYLTPEEYDDGFAACGARHREVVSTLGEHHSLYVAVQAPAYLRAFNEGKVGDRRGEVVLYMAASPYFGEIMYSADVERVPSDSPDIEGPVTKIGELSLGGGELPRFVLAYLASYLNEGGV